MNFVSEQVHSHDTIPTRAYWIGFVEGRVQTCIDFAIDVPTSIIGDLLEILQKEAVDVDIGPSMIRKFTVSWTRLDVRFVV